MLRISLSGPPNRRKQPERYVQFALKWLTKFTKAYKILCKVFMENYWRILNDNMDKWGIWQW
jgi:hypothetical protein